ncbi:Transmembrane protein 119 [Myotis davidii]|uniref:Transmembrane protein 119 n=1 Tax=Myotis davidii TaxID=225400 RepID=L5LZM5_MYODS|nr:Transmembrane protein 119 [Myotis davidii]
MVPGGGLIPTLQMWRTRPGDDTRDTVGYSERPLRSGFGSGLLTGCETPSSRSQFQPSSLEVPGSMVSAMAPRLVVSLLLLPPAAPDPGPTNFLDGIVDFFHEYVMLIAVVGSLVLLVMFVVCAAVITRQKHKASAYYPSSFPKKKYVDQSDRAGGPQAFSEVPDRAPDGRPEEALDSSQQLQADILAATQNLRSPTRAAPSGGDGARMTEGKSEGEQPGGQEEDRDAPGCGVPMEKPGVTEGPCSGLAEGVLGALEGPGEPEAAPSLAQEGGDPAGPPQSPCACGSVTPSV